MPLAPSMDHPGPMALCVRDLALLLQTIAGADPRDPTCSDRPVPDLLAALNRPLAKPRLGRVRGLFDDLAEPPVRALMDQVCDTFRVKGATVTDVALPGIFADVVQRHRIVMAVEGATFHAVRLLRHPEDYQPKIKALLEEGLACPAPDYARCKDHQRQLSQEILSCFQGVDALLAPAITGPAPDANSTGNPAFQAPWSYTGVPTVSFLAGRSSEGLPLAIQLVGRPWSEAELLASSAWCEQALGMEYREPPG
jgi:aspartyl-tRNA(Asn)/glutamyl-tRNA(Gln) amidotransferase subunit A